MLKRTHDKQIMQNEMMEKNQSIGINELIMLIVKVIYNEWH